MLPMAYVSSFFLRTFAPEQAAALHAGHDPHAQQRQARRHVKARRELGFAPTPVLDAFTEAYEWFKARGLVRQN